MRDSITVSAVAHAVILIVAAVGTNWFDDDIEIYDSIEVEFVDAEELEREARAPEPKDEPEQREKRAPEPERVAEDEVALPNIAPKPRERPKAQPVRRNIPNIQPLTKPRPPSRLNTSRLKALLDKRQKDAQDQAASRKSSADIKVRSSRSEFEVARIVAGVDQAIRAQIERCWSAPAGARYAETLIVRIRIYLRPDGSLVKLPEILDSARMDSDPSFRAAAEAARRAVQKCAPLDLPKDSYDVWRDVVLNFDPSRML